MTERWLRFGKFNLVGLLGAILQLTLLRLLTHCWHVPIVRATPIAVELVVLHNFVWHEKFTWNDRIAGPARQRFAALWRFHAGNGLVSITGNTVAMYWLVERLRVPVLPSAAGIVTFISAVNFMLADRWVYATLRKSA